MYGCALYIQPRWQWRMYVLHLRHLLRYKVRDAISTWITHIFGCCDYRSNYFNWPTHAAFNASTTTAHARRAEHQLLLKHKMPYMVAHKILRWPSITSPSSILYLQETFQFKSNFHNIFHFSLRFKIVCIFCPEPITIFTITFCNTISPYIYFCSFKVPIELDSVLLFKAS